jgi:hypothetical protein
MTGSLASDGQTTATGNLKMGNNRITGLANGTLSTDAVAFGQIGTIAPQNANNVAITGGAIDNTTIGTTTRSSVKATTLDLGLSTQSVAIGQGNASIMKNRIINGAMVISQGAAGATITPAVSSTYSTNYPVDRWQVLVGAASKLTTAQSSTATTGFNFSTLITSSSAYTVGASEVFSITQKIEGFNTSDLYFGTANAKTVTLSFWVRSSLTGTFGGSLQNSAANRSYPFSYLISVADTWEQKTITIAGDTTGTWIGATNGVGLTVNLGLGVGSTYSGTANSWAAADYRSATSATSVVGTSGATFYLTGVQIEVGSSATGYEYRLYNQELIACQRYYFKFLPVTGTSYFTTGWSETTTAANGVVNFPVQLRTNPTALEQSGTATDYRVVDALTGIACNAVPSFAGSQSTNTALVRFGVASGLTVGRCIGLSANSSTAAFLAWSAEL